MALSPRPLRGSDVASVLSEPGTKVPSSALTFGTEPGTVADGGALSDTVATIAGAVDTANGANIKATAASAAVQSAANKADAAATKADAASATANDAFAAAATASSSAGTALTRAGLALTTAGDAQSKADQTAASLDSVSLKATTASTNATRALTTANEASTAATDASTRASDAQTKAAAAATAATKAQADATSALGSIGTISTKADNAATKADSALSIANSTKIIADSALSIGNTADAKAQGAQTSASTAQTMATAAQTAAGTAQTSITDINARLAATPMFTADSSGLKLAFNGKNYVIPEVGAAPAAPAVVLASAGYRMPNTVFSLDPSLPAGTAALAVGVPGIQLNANGDGDVATMNEAISAIAVTHGQYGQVALKPASGVRPFAYFDQSTHSNSYDSLILPPVTGWDMFSAYGAPWWVSFVFTPVGTTGNQLMKVESAAGVHVYINVTGDGRLYVEQNNDAANGTEPVTPRSGLGKRSLITVLADGRSFNIYREGVRVFQSPMAGGLGGFNGLPAVMEFMNNAQGMCELIEGGPGNPSIAQHSAYVAAKGARYGIAVDVVTEGSATQIAKIPAPPIDFTQEFLSTANFPISDTPPIIAGRTLGGGLTMSAGTTNLFNYVFGTAVPGANVTTGQRVRDLFYLHHFSGNPMDGNVNTAPADTGHPLGDPKYWSVMRHYPVGHTYDVHVVGPDGLRLLVYGSANNSFYGMRQCYSGMIRLPTPFLPGTTSRIRWKKPGGRFSWAPWWLFSGDEYTAGPGGSVWNGFSSDFSQPTSSLRREATSAHCHELDHDDNFDRTPDGSPPGFSVDFIPVYDIYATQYTNVPSRVWQKNTGGYTWINGHTRTSFDQSQAFYDEVINWRNDGTNQIDMFMGPAGGPYTLIQTIQMEYHPDTYYLANGTQRTMGMHLMVSNQFAPTFAGGFPNVTNATEGAAITASSFPTIQAIDAWRGNVVNPDSFRS